MFGVRGVLCGMRCEGVYRGDKVHRRGLFVGAKLPSYQAQFLAPFHAESRPTGIKTGTASRFPKAQADRGKPLSLRVP